MSGFSLRLFEKRLLETVSYCKHHFNPEDIENCLRTAPFPANSMFAEYQLEQIAPFAVITEHKRRRWVANHQNPDLSVGLHGGRLLVSHLSFTVCDQFEETRFIGQCEVPAWDTWVYWARDYRNNRADYYDYVISWIPLELLEIVQWAIKISTVKGLDWLEEAEVYDYSFFPVLKEAGYFTL